MGAWGLHQRVALPLSLPPIHPQGQSPGLPWTFILATSRERRSAPQNQESLPSGLQRRRPKPSLLDTRSPGLPSAQGRFIAVRAHALGAQSQSHWCE